MKKVLLFSAGFSFVFLLSCKTISRSQISKDYPYDSLRHTSDLIFFKSDTLKIEQDTIFVKTDKVVKKVDEKNLRKEDVAIIEFVGSTEIQKAISDNSEIPANAGIGVRFTKNYGSPTSLLHIDKLELDITMSIASTIDTIKAKINSNNEILNINAFGSSILLPLNSGQSVSINGRTFMNKRNTINIIFGQNWGLQGTLSASNRVWSIANVSQNVSSLSGSLGLFSELIPMEYMDEFSISFGLDGSIRWIFGNLGHSYAKDFRESIIGTRKTFYYGFEPNITIRLKDVKAIASFPILFSKDDVPGLTKGQFVTMIKFIGGFPLSLAKK